MGCLNSTGSFSHWFANIHLSGPCNRKCYFCIGQHMMDLDGLDTTGTWPLPGWEDFIDRCAGRNVKEVFLTGTNTDPLLYKHTQTLIDVVHNRLGVPCGIRTNAVANLDLLRFYDKGSITICSTNSTIYRKMMGQGSPPDLARIVEATKNWSSMKVNIVLGPENRTDIHHTIADLGRAGVKRINVREPYGQPHQGNPLWAHREIDGRLGMPVYHLHGAEVTYWDVHYVEVESVNLYANGRVSEDYPITRGHSPEGTVKDQAQFPGGRIQEQWVSEKRLRRTA